MTIPRMITRTEHLEWCKQRARQYLDRGNVDMAMTSFVSDLSKHESTADKSNDTLLLAKAVQIAVSGNMTNARAFIDAVE